MASHDGLWHHMTVRVRVRVRVRIGRPQLGLDDLGWDWTFSLGLDI